MAFPIPWREDATDAIGRRQEDSHALVGHNVPVRLDVALGLASFVVGGGVGPLDLAIVEANLFKREPFATPGASTGRKSVTITSDSLDSMYFCLSPVARHSSTLIAAMCWPLQQCTAHFGLTLSIVFTVA
jgi:hypothetical protein